MKNAEELKESALIFLQKHFLAVVATADNSGKPEAAAVFYDIDDDFTLHFMTRETSRKAKNIFDNKKVALVINDNQELVTVQLEGEAELDKEGFMHLADKLAQKPSLEKLNLPVFKLPGSNVITYKVKLNWLRMLDWSMTEDLKIEDYRAAFKETDL
ncbi:MAG: hypothetical protein COT81_02175 [Candidatus Buchananbacteria bacterium CG10_big_fil_rev_8_21_14_0_10_42_9]|uniref:Pyridoxamine 5'-phosphate oxidase N-terminal domain-containing protein n=1 Tax=Candidatus Buchananbacteria bacterium CG10_big_fil_rev_8_21_14_0_10_42_9 TaxID=1974526 RepID=A0A2H0W1R9_9BACT|nr:MAG: hypothetical protein COT81_02175 [Candidatus Buchananbacteria bacterium CG10_big_fil_rev_8_21_14_0_10_42_9]